MKIEDILLCVPRTLYFYTIGKIPRFELSERVKEQAVKDGFYHFVRDSKTADAIIQSEYLRPSDFLTSYGKPCTFLFCGAPDIENYAKNLTSTKSLANPYINPTMVSTAIRFMPPSKEHLNNYKFRGLTDNVIMYEGYCILPHNAVEKIKMVPDLKRDETGNPIKDENGEYSVYFREALESELIPGKEEYRAKPDYLQYMKEKAIEYGYLKHDGSKYNSIVAIADISRMESSQMKKAVNSNWKDLFKNFIANLKTSKIEKSAKDILKSFSFSKKNPYQDKNFAKFVSELQTKQGLTQYDLNTLLPEFNKSKEGVFFKVKQNQIESTITRKGIHGKDHSNRVSLLAMIIAKKEGILENDTNNRIKDILQTASTYHDIGRILDQGPHAKRGANKVKKMDLYYSDLTKYSEDDKKIVMALIESHEGKPDKINSVVEKLSIQEPENIALAKRLNSIVRDADALDRVRLDRNTFGYKTNLNPKYLVNNTSKQLLNASYQLEYLTKKVPNITNITTIGTEESSLSEKASSKKEDFMQKLRVDEKNLTKNNNQKTTESQQKKDELSR